MSTSTLASSEQSNIEKGKKAAAYQAVDENVNSNTKVVGIGSGSTIVFAVERLAERIKSEHLDITCIPTSFQSKQLLLKYNMKVSDLETFAETDVTIDGADEVDAQLNCIKGGGGCHLQEKLIAFVARELVIVADIRKHSKKFGQQWRGGVPIEVVPMAHKLVQEKLEKLFGGKAILRQAVAKAGPVVTDNGNFIIDWHFESKDNNDNVEYDWKSINSSIKMIPGVMETGLFIGMAKKVYFGKFDGTVLKVDK